MQLISQQKSSPMSYDVICHCTFCNCVRNPMLLPIRNKQAQVVQKLASAIHRINHYPADKYYGKRLRYSLDSALSGG